MSIYPEYEVKSISPKRVVVRRTRKDGTVDTVEMSDRWWDLTAINTAFYLKDHICVMPKKPTDCPPNSGSLVFHVWTCGIFRRCENCGISYREYMRLMAEQGYALIENVFADREDTSKDMARIDLGINDTIPFHASDIADAVSNVSQVKCARESGLDVWVRVQNKSGSQSSENLVTPRITYATNPVHQSNDSMATATIKIEFKGPDGQSIDEYVAQTKAKIASVKKPRYWVGERLKTDPSYVVYGTCRDKPYVASLCSTLTMAKELCNLLNNDKLWQK